MIEKKFLQHLFEEQFWQSGEKVVVGVSGGVDSMVLLHLLTRLPQDLRPRLVAAHINHQLRPEAEEEEAMVREFCQSLSVPFRSIRWEKKNHPQTGTEVAARTFRYDFFKETLKKEKAQVLLTAHHLNDQAETILMRMVKGSRLESLTGIQKARFFGDGKLVRPLLPFSKEELYTYAKEKAVPFSEDVTNHLPDFTRNRFRNTIFPLLRKENNQVDAHLVEFAEDLRAMQEVAHSVVEEKAKELIHSTEEGLEWSVDAFLFLPTSMQRMLLYHLMDRYYSANHQTYGKELIPIILKWMQKSGPNSSLDLPGEVMIEKSYQKVRLSKKKKPRLFEPLALSINQTVRVPNGRVGLFEKKEMNDYRMKQMKEFVFLSADTSLPLTVRNRKKGDRIQLANGGTKKLSRVFIDQKVSAIYRDQAIVIEDAAGNILWVPGFKESSLSIKKETDTIQYILFYEQLPE